MINPSRKIFLLASAREIQRYRKKDRGMQTKYKERKKEGQRCADINKEKKRTTYGKKYGEIWTKEFEPTFYLILSRK